MGNLWLPSQNCADIWIPTYQPELYHHGIKGQKWGVRRFQNYDGTRTKAGKEKSKKKLTPEEEYKQKWNHGDSLGANLAAATAMAVGGAAATVLGSTTVGPVLALAMGKEIPGMAVALGKGIAADHRMKKLKTDDKLGLKLKDPSKEWTVEQDLKATNPEYNKFSKLDRGATHNCMLSSMTFDLRRRGYDVRANRAITGWQTEDVQHWYPGFKAKETNFYSKMPKTREEYLELRKSEPKTKKDLDEYTDKCIANLSKEKKGARGLVLVTWSGGVSGHAMAYEVHDDGPHLYDPQVGKEYKDIRKIARNTTSFEIGRLDNLQPDPNTIKEVTKH